MGRYRKIFVFAIVMAAMIFMASSAETDKTETKKKGEDKVMQKRKMQSCLTLVRSLYTREETNIQDFIMKHPTQAKDRLLNKILAQMMLSCVDKVAQYQVEILQEFKDRPAEFDSTQEAYSPLLNFDLDKYKVDESLPEEKQRAPVDMSQQEYAMQTIVEDLSEEMKREKEEELKNQRGSVNFFFYDLQNMSSATKLLYVAGILGFFFLIFYILMNKLVNKPVDFTKQKRQEKLTKKSSKSTSGKKTN